MFVPPSDPHLCCLSHQNLIVMFNHHFPARELLTWARTVMLTSTIYCEHDALLCMEIGEHTGIFDIAVAWGRHNAVTPAESFTRGITFFVGREYEMRCFKHKNFLSTQRCSFPSLDYLELQIRSASSHIGGITLDPDPTTFNNRLRFIIILDIISAYPSVIQAYKICPTALSLVRPCRLEFGF